MKYSTLCLKLCFLTVFILSVSGAYAQVRIYEEGSYVKAEINDEQKDEIMAATTKILNEYARVATFRDDNNNFSDDSYTEFVSLFSGSAEVYDDLIKKDAQNINYASYADKVFQYMQGTGVKFELNETYLDEISYDSSGFYIVQLSFEKIMFNGLDDNNEIVNFPNNGRPVDLKMRVEVPEYDLSDASIVGVTGEAAKVKVESASMISADLNYHLGNVSKTATTLSPGWSDDLPVSYNAYGVDVVYRRSLNNKKSLYLLVGASLAFNNFNSTLNDYQGEFPSFVNTLNGGEALSASGAETPGTEPSLLSILSQGGNQLNERLQVIDIQIPLGVSLRILEAYNYDLFLDIAAVPIYSISSSGNYTGDLAFQNFPTDRERFSQGFVDNVLNEFENGNIISEYIGTSNYDEELTEVANQFSAAVQVTPLFHYKFNFNVGYNFLPYFANETNHLGNGERVELAELTNISGAQNPSVLQMNYKNVGILRYGARIGLVFKL
jgi:hypothetical protein